jgi:hypothetical protein
MKIISFNQTKTTHNGIMSKTILSGAPVSGDEKDIEIVTIKNSRKQLVSYYQYGKYTPAESEGKFYSFSFIMFQSKRGEVISTPCPRVTAKMVAEQHAKAVSQFISQQGWEVQP